VEPGVAMPYGLRQRCTYPGCQELLEPGKHGRCKDHPYPDAHDANSKKLYDSWQWKRLRKRQLAMQPWCEECLKSGIYTSASEVDHKEPHNGDPTKFFTGQLQSLDKICHSRKTASEVLNRHML
jgi:5-methylcytosine-specific restriction protein A